MKNKLLSISILAALAASSQSQTRAGLIDWYERLTTFSESGGTLNIVTVGDSHMEGVMDTTEPGDNFPYRWSNQFRRDFRAANGEPLGGYGFLSASNSANHPLFGAPTAYTGGTQFGVWNDRCFNDAQPARGVCLKYAETTQAGAYREWYKWPGGLSESNRSWVERPANYRFVYQRRPGGGRLAFILTNYGRTIEFGRVVVDCDSGTNQESYGHISEPLNVTQGFYIRAVNLDGKPTYWEGCYLDTPNDRLNVVNYACGGSTAAAWNSVPTVEGILRAKPDVILYQTGHNEIFGNKYTPEVWKEHVRGFIQKVQARNPKVSILLVLGFYYQPWQKTPWETLHTYARELCAEYRVGLWSWHENASGMSASEYAVPMGIMNAGKGHLNRSGQGWLASQMLSLLNKKVVVG